MKTKIIILAILILGLITACSSTEDKPLDLVEGLVSASAVLDNGVAVTGLSGARRTQLFYTLNVPTGATNLEFKLSGGTGDADLYVRLGANPTVSQFNCRPYKNGNNETCSQASPAAGTYYIMIRGYSSFSGASLVAKYTAPGGSDSTTTLENGKPITALAGSRGNEKLYKLTLPSGATNLNIRIAGGSGDADLYLKRGSAPTTQSFECRPYLNGNNETCTVANPQAGTYYVMLRAYLNYSGVTLTASYDSGSEPPPPPPPTAGNFDITFVFGPNITNAQKQIFNNAAARWEQVIVGDLPNAQLNKQANLCGSGDPAFSGTVDDVVIYADVGPRDGPGGVLASAGPCLIRNGGLTTYGVMNFDSADAGGSGFVDTILHEMGHVLGIGTLWETFGLVNYNNNCPANPRYSGSSAKTEWAALGGSGNIPVEQDGGGGTRCGHWDEETFSNELMTGFLNGGGINPLSRMTIGSLEDMGYVVNKAAANPYTLPSCSPNCNRSALDSQGLEYTEELLKPIGTIMPNGEIQRLKSDSR